MFVKNIYLTHFRNLQETRLDFHPQVNLVIGKNAQGKTNLLEALFTLALTKSHRTAKEKELIQWEQEYTKIQAEVSKKYGDLQLEFLVSEKGKKARVNHVEQKKLSQFVGALNVVMFAPEDLKIVKGTPQVRRRFLDMELGQVQPSYLHDLQQYHRILIQRNNLLKKGTAEDLLEAWNTQLVEIGIKIMKKRKKFIEKLEVWARKIHYSISHGSEELSLSYVPSFSQEEDREDESILFDQFMIKLGQVKDQERRRGMTLVGPHRDDLLFKINDRPVQNYGSQGQQRTTALSLKLAEIELIHEMVGEYPILLLDDVLSELDQHRQNQLIETFQLKVQTFITSTGVEGIDLKKIEDARIFKVQEGTIS